jgi:hypothetical protein
MDSKNGRDGGDHNENGEASCSRVLDDKGGGDNVEPRDDETVAFG